jgi:hypothetical protein
MTTHCMIMRTMGSGCVLGIYCHMDGHPSSMLPKLEQRFTDATSLVGLIDRGDVTHILADGRRGQNIASGPHMCSDSISEIIAQAREHAAAHVYVWLFDLQMWVHIDLEQAEAGMRTRKTRQLPSV